MMTYLEEFEGILGKGTVYYTVTNKSFYRTKYFKVHSNIGSNHLKQKLTNVKLPLVLNNVKPPFRKLFKDENELMWFTNAFYSYLYLKTKDEVVKFINIYKELFPNYKLSIDGPKDDIHLEELKVLKSGKKTNINSIILKEVASKPTFAGYRYKISGCYIIPAQPKDINDLKEMVVSFAEQLGGVDNENFKLTGNISQLLNDTVDINFNYSVREIMRGSTNKISFTLHHKDVDELFSLNFMSNNVYITNATEYTK